MFRRTLKLSSRKKLIGLAAVAVLLPVLLLTFVQYRSLTDLENKTKGAVKENLRQTLLNVGRKVEGKFEELASQSLIPVGGLKISEQADRGRLESHFANVKQAHPEIDRVFVFAYCACKTAKENYAYSYSADGLRRFEQPDFHEDMGLNNAFHSYEKARLSNSYLDAGRNFLFWQDSCLVCLANGKPHLSAFIFYPLFDVERREQIGFAGLSLNTGYVKTELLARSVTEALSGPDLAVADSDVVIGVTDENGGEIYANATDHRDYVIRTAFSRPFSKWEMGIGFKNTDIESLARRSFRESLLLTILVLCMLLLGIVLTLRATDREVSLAQAKSTFVSNVSHELKTPLSLIRLFAEILEFGRVKNNDKAREYYRIIGDESRRLTQLIDNILDFSKIEAGRKEYDFVELNVADVVESVVSSYRYRIVNAGFDLEVKLDHAVPPASVDRDAIAQAVLNLLDNAVKYSPETKWISVEVSAQDGCVTIQVADRGLGIARTEQEKIFEKFYRVGNGLVRNTKGSGLGLALVRHIVEAHQGGISVESAPGEGSRFTIRIPFKADGKTEQSVITGMGEYNVAQSTYR